MAVTPVFMRFSVPTLLLLLGLAAGPAHGQSSLNPLNWFSDDEPVEALDVASAAEEEEASAILDEARAAFDNGNTGKANSVAKKIVKRYPTADAAADALSLRGRILMSRGRWVKAFNTFQTIIEDHPGYERFNRVIGDQFDCATALMEGARGRIFGFIPGFRQYREAARQFETIVRNAPYGDYAPLALMNVALIASEKRDKPNEAIDALDRLINFYPQSMLAPDAYYNLAQIYGDLVKGPEYDQGSTRQAIRYYEDFLILFPDSRYVKEVEANLAKMENLLAKSRLNLGNFYYLYRNNNTAALVFYNEAITIAPESEAADTARARIEDIEQGVRPTTGSTLFKKLLFAD